ncbi:hypothetical protein [Moorena sp. SIO3H5]|nr:hypothetical protein [Moorena sp. SIO3H5]
MIGGSLLTHYGYSAEDSQLSAVLGDVDVSPPPPKANLLRLFLYV